MLSVIDYERGLTATALTNVLKLDRVQNEAMRVILGNTKDTPIGTVRQCQSYWESPRTHP